MPKVELKENENPEFVIRRFKRLCDRAGIVSDVRRKEFYEKPTWERKRKRTIAVNRQAKRLKRDIMQRQAFAKVIRSLSRRCLREQAQVESNNQASEA